MISLRCYTLVSSSTFERNQEIRRKGAALEERWFLFKYVQFEIALTYFLSCKESGVTSVFICLGTTLICCNYPMSMWFCSWALTSYQALVILVTSWFSRTFESDHFFCLFWLPLFFVVQISLALLSFFYFIFKKVKCGM